MALEAEPAEAATATKPAPSYRYPFAASPDIIRAHQKDAYFQGVLLEHLSTILRKIYGARFIHTYTTEVRTIADVLYLGLTTFVGNRTLGEEYCDIVQVEGDSGRLPSIGRRSAYITASILFPYLLNRNIPRIRRAIRSVLEPSVQQSPQKTTTISTTAAKLRTYLSSNLDAITSPAPLYAISLTTFYFSGAFYHLSKRLLNLRYIFTRVRASPSSSSSTDRAGYEILGVLLLLQLSVQTYLHIHTTLSASTASDSQAPPALANPASLSGGSAAVGAGVEVSLDPNSYSSSNQTLLFESAGTASNRTKSQQKVQRLMNTPYASHDEPRIDLTETDASAEAQAETGKKAPLGWLSGRQARKCTLCLEFMKDPSVTTCGHVFCWTCIVDWCREKPECPLCRQASLPQHVLPLRG